MRNRKRFAVVLLLALNGWAAGTAPVGVSRAARPKTAGQAAKSDAEIQRDIRARFAKSKIGVEKHEVHVQGGVATIEGKTDVVQHKGVATRLARAGGAVAVVNHIQISDAGRQKAAQNLQKGRRRLQIRRGEPRSETGGPNQP